MKVREFTGITQGGFRFTAENGAPSILLYDHAPTLLKDEGNGDRELLLDYLANKCDERDMDVLKANSRKSYRIATKLLKNSRDETIGEHAPLTERLGALKDRLPNVSGVVGYVKGNPRTVGGLGLAGVLATVAVVSYSMINSSIPQTQDLTPSVLQSQIQAYEAGEGNANMANMYLEGIDRNTLSEENQKLYDRLEGLVGESQ